MEKKQQYVRFRDYGFKPGFLPAGTRNSIADVRGVTVGHFTKIAGDSIRTGVTVVDPGVQNLFKTKIPAAIAIGNGYGKLTGISQIEELGTLEAPIALTSTLAVGKVMRGIVDIVIQTTPDMQKMESVNAVVGEINDGRLNDIHKDVIQPEDVSLAYKSRSKDFELGNVGGGTGARCFSWKGGIGTASRTVVIDKKKYTVGALVQTNFGGSLSIMGVPIGEILGKNDYSFLDNKPDGSCMIVIATDAPLDSRQLKRVAKRALLGMVRTGAIMAHASGDYAIAFSTVRDGSIREEDLNPLFLAAVETVEESIYDALFAAETMTGSNGFVLESLPKKKVVELLKKYGK